MDKSQILKNLPTNSLFSLLLCSQYQTLLFFNLPSSIPYHLTFFFFNQILQDFWKYFVWTRAGVLHSFPRCCTIYSLSLVILYSENSGSQFWLHLRIIWKTWKKKACFGHTQYQILNTKSLSTRPWHYILKIPWMTFYIHLCQEQCTKSLHVYIRGKQLEQRHFTFKGETSDF